MYFVFFFFYVTGCVLLHHSSTLATYSSFLHHRPAPVLPPSLSLSYSLSLSLRVGLRFKFKFKQLHWHDKRESGLSPFSAAVPAQSEAPWPSNLCSTVKRSAAPHWRRSGRRLRQRGTLRPRWRPRPCVSDGSDRVSVSAELASEHPAVPPGARRLRDKRQADRFLC